MELPLTPLEFARRTRKLYPEREAVVDGELRLTYAQFFERCDRWSRALRRLGIKQGDRVAYVAPNTHAMLESFYAVPQLGAVLVPLNYRLIAADFSYLINHSGARVVCAHSDYLDCIDEIRAELPNVTSFVALEGRLDHRHLLVGQCPKITLHQHADILLDAGRRGAQLVRREGNKFILGVVERDQLLALFGQHGSLFF